MYLPEEIKAEIRGLLREAHAAARGYDGSEAKDKALYAPLLRLEEVFTAQSGGANSGLVRRRLESALVKMSLPETGIAADMPRTTDGFLNLACEFDKRMARVAKSESTDFQDMLTQGGAVIHYSDAVFVPPQKGGFIPKENEVSAGSFERKTQERLEMLTTHLRQDGVLVGGKIQNIYSDDLDITFGAVRSDMVRKTPYTIVRIPRLDVEVALCEEVGNATFVKKGTVGDEFWRFFDKEALEKRPDIKRVEFHNEQEWWKGVQNALQDSAPSAANKVDLQKWAAKSANMDLDLVKETLLAHYHAKGLWLTGNERAGPDAKPGSYILEHGPYAGKIKVKDFMNSVNRGYHGLPKGLSLRRLSEEVRQPNNLPLANMQPLDAEDMSVEGVKETLLAHYHAKGLWLTGNERAGPDAKPGSYILEHGPYAGKMTTDSFRTSVDRGYHGLPKGLRLRRLSEDVRQPNNLPLANMRPLKSGKADEAPFEGEAFTSEMAPV